MTKIYNKKMWDFMIAVIYKRTKIGCEKFIEDTLEACSVPAIKNYINRNFKNNTKQWALWIQQHFPLLLQITSINPLKSYHSKLKRLTLSSHSLIDIYIS